MQCPNCAQPMKQYNRTSSYVCGYCGEHAERPAELEETPEKRAEEIIKDTLDGFMSEPYTYYPATLAIMEALDNAGLRIVAK